MGRPIAACVASNKIMSTTEESKTHCQAVELDFVVIDGLEPNNDIVGDDFVHIGNPNNIEISDNLALNATVDEYESEHRMNVLIDVDINSSEVNNIDMQGANRVEKLAVNGRVLYVARYQDPANPNNRKVIKKWYGDEQSNETTTDTQNTPIQHIPPQPEHEMEVSIEKPKESQTAGGYPLQYDCNNDVLNAQATSINKKAHAVNGNMSAIDESMAPDEVKVNKNEVALGPEVILAKLFQSPISQVMSSHDKWIPQGTEKVGRGYGGDYEFTPASWPDPLCLMGFTHGTVTHLGTTEPATAVTVTSDAAGLKGRHTLSTIGVEIEGMISTAVSPTGLRALIPIPNAYDIGSLSTLASIVRNLSLDVCTDESVFLRLLLLIESYQKPEWYMRNTRIPYGVNFDGSITMKHLATTKMDYIKASATSGVDPASRSVAVWAVSITRYAQMLSGKESPKLACTYMKNQEKGPPLKTTDRTPDFGDCVIVPVTMGSSGTKKLIPYILAFTTTEWWNFAMYLQIDMWSNAPAGNDYKFTVNTRPKASSVLIQGKTRNILLVVTDAPASSTLRTKLMIGGTDGPVINYTESYNEFALLANNWLGRGTEAGKETIRETDMLAAWRDLCMTLNIAGVKERALAIAPELCFTLPMGYGVHSDATAPDDKHFGGVVTYYQKVATKIGGEKIVSWDTIDDTVKKDWATGLQVWRVTPLGRFQDSLITVKDHEFSGWNRLMTSYSVEESSGIWRVLIACGYYERSQMCNVAGFEHTQVLSNHLMGSASLIAGVVNWLLTVRGITVIDWNDMNPRMMNILPGELFQVLCQLTQGFSTRPQRSDRLCRDKALFVVPASKVLGGVADDVFLHCSGYVPYWYVDAMIFKFFGKHGVPVIPRSEFMVDITPNSSYEVDDSDYYGYVFDGSNAYSVPWITSTLAYEKRNGCGRPYFTILMPAKNHRVSEVAKLGWYPYSVFDRQTCEINRKETHSEKEDLLVRGVVCLNTVIIPIFRAERTKTKIEVMVGDGSHQDPTNDRSFIKFRDPNGLRYPDPWLSWVTEGLKKAGIGFLEGGFTGAALAGLMHVVNGAVGLVADWEKSHSGSDDVGFANSD